MSLRNELISEEEVQKHKLDQLMRSHHPRAWTDGRPSTFRHAWTVDRERGFFLVRVKTVENVGPSGRLEPTSTSVWILDVNGKRVQATLRKAPDSSTDIREQPFRIMWELIELEMPAASELPRDMVLEYLKQALSTYGHFGAHGQIPNTIVTFSF